jgi:hypothetical protein
MKIVVFFNNFPCTITPSSLFKPSENVFFQGSWIAHLLFYKMRLPISYLRKQFTDVKKGFS